MKKLYIIIIVIILFLAAGLYIDRSSKVSVLPQQPTEDADQNSTIPEANYKVYGIAPEFPEGLTWLNSGPLKMSELKDKVVLIDFWTYSCINCIRTLPYVTKWYDTYKDDGFVIIGVHTPEFAFEKETDNVKKAIKQFGINYPVVQDNDYQIWRSYDNHYWPAEYLINKKGEIVEKHFGEGKYVETENNIRSLLGMKPEAKQEVKNLSGIGSPEMYFGTDRLEFLTRDQLPSVGTADYTIEKDLSLNTFSIGGKWFFDRTNIELKGDMGEIDLKFRSAKLYMVASSDNPVTITVTVDGKVQPSITVQASQLYTLFDSEDYSEHFAEISIQGQGLKAFTFTFG